MTDHDGRGATTAPDPHRAGTPAAAPTRRAVLVGVAAVGAVGAAGLLAACGGDTSTPAGAGPTTTNPVAPPPPPSPEVMHTTDIPVGGGMVYKNANVVVTQPKAGEFKAFDATCRHLGCQVASVRDGKINCPCHGSQYNIADGSVAHGPATSGLPEKHVIIAADTITVS
jgi:Rieske Fe-S protein